MQARGAASREQLCSPCCCSWSCRSWGVGQLAARGVGEAPFVICTGTGLVWVNPDGTPVEDHDKTHPGCPVCALGKLAASAVLPVAPVLTLPAAQATRPAPPVPDVALAPRTAPPLPARGPPPVS